MGQPLMPWQRLVADVGGELVEHPSGILVPAFRTVVFTVERQNGKTTLVLSWEVQRAIGWEDYGPQRIAYSAQTGKDARNKLLDDQVPILERHRKALGIQAINRSNGNEGVVWHNGSRLGLLASTEEAGHGKTIHLGVKDEYFADTDNRRDQALIPAMATRVDAQVVACSTMGTDASEPWNRLVEQGRAAVAARRREGVAYFEWSVPEDEDIDDPKAWWTYMPAMGHTIDESVIRDARLIMTDGDFRRAFGNQQTKVDDRVIPAHLWHAVCDPKAMAEGRLVFALDATPERTAASVVVCSDSQVIEVVEHRRTDSPTWLVEFAQGLAARHRDPLFVVARRSPAGALLEDLEAANLRVLVVEPSDETTASALMFDAIVDGTVTVRSEPVLDAAVAGVAKQLVGDSFKWSRKSSAVDISPLVGATLALWGSRASGGVPLMRFGR